MITAALWWALTLTPWQFAAYTTLAAGINGTVVYLGMKR
jgi:hypothetical protein